MKKLIYNLAVALAGVCLILLGMVSVAWIVTTANTTTDDTVHALAVVFVIVIVGLIAGLIGLIAKYWKEFWS